VPWSPLQARMGRLLRQMAASPVQAAGRLGRELLKLWPALWTWSRIEGVEPTNNAAERALRKAVLWRKGSFGNVSFRGLRMTERLLTASETCRQQGRSLLAYLTEAITALRAALPAPSILAPVTH
jgi:transposase